MRSEPVIVSAVAAENRGLSLTKTLSGSGLSRAAVTRGGSRRKGSVASEYGLPPSGQAQIGIIFEPPVILCFKLSQWGKGEHPPS